MHIMRGGTPGWVCKVLRFSAWIDWVALGVPGIHAKPAQGVTVLNKGVHIGQTPVVCQTLNINIGPVRQQLNIDIGFLLKKKNMPISILGF